MWHPQQMSAAAPRALRELDSAIILTFISHGCPLSLPPSPSGSGGPRQLLPSCFLHLEALADLCQVGLLAHQSFFLFGVHWPRAPLPQMLSLHDPFSSLHNLCHDPPIAVT
jgi:hypothetical protein